MLLFYRELLVPFVPRFMISGGKDMVFTVLVRAPNIFIFQPRLLHLRLHNKISIWRIFKTNTYYLLLTPDLQSDDSAPVVIPLCEWYVDDGCAGVSRWVYLGSWNIWRYWQSSTNCTAGRCCRRFWGGLHGSLFWWCCDDVSCGNRSTLFQSIVLIDANTIRNGHHSYNNGLFLLKRMICRL